MSDIMYKMLFLLLFSSSNAYSQSISIVEGNANPEKLGYDTSYTLSGLDPNKSYSFQWSTRENDDYVQAWQTFDLTNNFCSRVYDIPGRFDVRCIYTPAKTRENMNPQPSAPILRNVTISPPTISAASSGTNVDTQYNPSNQEPSATDLNGARGMYLFFPISDLGEYPGSIWAQEFNTNKRVFNQPPADDVVWFPKVPEDAADPDNKNNNQNIVFRITKNSEGKFFLIDLKRVDIDPGDNPPLAPQKFGSYTQALRLCWRNYEGKIKTSSSLPATPYNTVATQNNPPRWQTQPAN